MCGRISQTKAIELVERRFKVKYPYGNDWPIYYNGAPSHFLPVITNDKPDQVQLFRWGLIPPWSDQPETKYSMINARAETLEDRASYKVPFQKQRCLVIADGYYEWKNTGRSKQPFRLSLQDESLFAFAGLWEYWENEEHSINSFTIITTESNPVIKKIHNRMPVILPKEVERQWLNQSFGTDELRSLLRPYPHNNLHAYPVSKLVNNPENNIPEVTEPGDQGGEQLTI